MSDLVAFLNARLDEDEATAKAASEDGWPELGITVAQAGHVARHDPARVLRDVEAKRAILDNAAAAETYARRFTGDAVSIGQAAAYEHVLSRLAAVYQDHLDYDPAWAA